MSKEKEKSFWCVSRDYWTLPVEVDCPEGNDVASVKPAEVPMTNPMIEALIRVLDRTCFTVKDGRWMMMAERLAEIADPIPEGQDPQDCVTWSRKIQPRPALHWRDTGFVEFLYASGRFRSRDHASLCFRLVANALCDWLVNWKRPVDFGLFDLVPLPLRRNWKEVLLTRFFHSSQKKKFTLWELRHNLLSGQFTAVYRRAKLFHWILDVRLKRPWWLACYQRERLAQKRLRADYGASHVAALKRTSQDAYEIFLSYLAEVRRPFGFLRRSPRPGTYGLAKIIRSPVLLGGVPAPGAASVAIDVRLRTQGAAGSLAGQDEGVPVLRPVRPEVIDVRDQGSDLDEPGDGED